jgi:hypothetical protein
MGFLIRWGVALALVAATFNPTRWNYVHWGWTNRSLQTPLVVLVGIVLLIGWIIYLRATFRSIGPVGMALVLALLAALVWVFYDRGWLSLENRSLNTWLGILALSVVLGVGLSWSIVRRRVTGQADVDDLDDE